MTESRELDDLKLGPIRHQELPPSLVARVESVRSTLQEVYPQSIEEWLDGFQRDLNPEPEVVWWERLAQCYVEYSRHNELSVNQKRRHSDYDVREGQKANWAGAIRQPPI